MYHFNEIEKHVLNEMVTLQGFQSMFGNLIIKKINRALIKISPNENKATMELHYYKGDQDERKKDYEEIFKHNMELLCTTVSLLDYLLSNHLVYEYEVLAESKGDYTLGFHPSPEKGGVQWEIKDKELVSKIIKYSHKVLIPTADLKYIVDNNYRTRSEVKFRYQMFATWTAIFVTFLIGILSIALNGGSNKCETQDKNISTPYSGH